MRQSRYSPGRASPRFSGGWPVRVALLAMLVTTTRVWAQSSTDTPPTASAGECCKEVLFPLGGRIIALGQAIVADTAPDMAFANPAGILAVRKTTFLVQYRPLVGNGKLIGLNLIPRPFRFGTFALSYMLADLDTMTVYLGQEQPVDVGQIYTAAHILGATFATGLGAGVSGGVSYKLYAFVAPGANKGDTGGGSGVTQMIDAGLQYHPRRFHWLALGASVANAGVPLQVVNFEQADRTPTRTRFGATMEYLHFLQRDTTLSGTVSVQLESGGDNGSVPSVGTQVTLGHVISVRAGWVFAGDALTAGPESGAALGVGVALQRYTLDVARTLTTNPLETNQPFHVTFGMSF